MGATTWFNTVGVNLFKPCPLLDKQSGDSRLYDRTRALSLKSLLRALND